MSALSIERLRTLITFHDTSDDDPHRWIEDTVAALRALLAICEAQAGMETPESVAERALADPQWKFHECVAAALHRRDDAWAAKVAAAEARVKVAADCAYRLRAACEVVLLRYGGGALTEIRNALDLNQREGF